MFETIYRLTPGCPGGSPSPLNTWRHNNATVMLQSTATGHISKENKTRNVLQPNNEARSRIIAAVEKQYYTFLCVRVDARARGRVSMLTYLSSIQSVCAILWRHLRPLWLHHI